MTNKENIEEDQEVDVFHVTLAEIKEWRNKGPLSKLYNFTKWLAGSTQQIYKWLELALYRIPRDNKTR